MQTPGGWVIADVKSEAFSAKTLAQDVWMGDLLHKAACPQYIKDIFHKSRVPFSLYPVSNRCAYYSRFEGGGRVPAVQPQIGVRAMTASGLRDPARSACCTGVGRDVPTPTHLHRVWYTLAHPSGYVLAFAGTARRL